MAFPTGGGTQRSLALMLSEIQTRAATIKQTAIDFKAKLAAQNVPGTDVFTLCVTLVNAKAYIQARAAVTGLQQYARDVYNDPSFDITAEYNAMIAALDAALATINAQTPSALAAAQYTPGATAAFRNQLQALADSID